MTDPTQHTRIRVESPGVNVAVVRKSYEGWEFLLLRRAKTESYGGFWGFMTGGKRGDETVAQVVKRELKEETKLDPECMWATEYLVQFYEPEVDAIWILPLIVVVVSAEAKVELSPENDECRWLSAEKAKYLLSWKNQIKAVDDIMDEIEIFPARTWVEIEA